MREKHHGPPPTDRTVFVHSPEADDWAICTPRSAGGWTLSWVGPAPDNNADGWPDGFLWYELPGIYVEATVSAAADDWTFRATKDGPTATPPSDSQPGYPRVCEVFIYPHQSPPLFGVATVGGVRQFPVDVARRVLQMFDDVPALPLTPGRYRSPEGIEGELYPFDAFAGCYRFAPDGHVPPAVVGNGTTDGLVRFGKDATAGWVRIGDEGE